MYVYRLRDRKIEKLEAIRRISENLYETIDGHTVRAYEDRDEVANKEANRLGLYASITLKNNWGTAEKAVEEYKAWCKRYHLKINREWLQKKKS